MRFAAGLAAAMCAGLAVMAVLPPIGARLAGPSETGLLLAATLLMAAATLMMYREAYEARMLQLRPHVSVRFEINPSNTHIIDAVVVNDGLGPARDVGFHVLKGDFRRWAGSGRRRKADQLASEMSVFQHGVSYLGPGQVLRMPFTHARSVQERFQEMEEFMVKATFRDLRKTLHEATYVTAFSEFADFAAVQPSGPQA